MTQGGMHGPGRLTMTMHPVHVDTWVRRVTRRLLMMRMDPGDAEVVGNVHPLGQTRL